MPMTSRAYRRGFTLLEVNLAVFVMATGILTISALYSLGFRENRQSVEDVAGAAWAEAYLSPLIQGLSATNLPWSVWKEKIGDEPSTDGNDDGTKPEGVWPKDGWMAYITVKDDPEKEQVRYIVNHNASSIAKDVWGKVKTAISSNASDPGVPDGFTCALVVTRRGTIVKLAFRLAKRRETLMTQPAYVTEVRFNGNPDL